MFKKKVTILVIVAFFISSTCFACNDRLDDCSAYFNFTLSPRVSFSELIIQDFFKMEQKENFLSLKNNISSNNVNPPIAVSKEVEYLEKTRRQMRILADNADIKSLEDTIQLQDALKDNDKDWILLTEAVAARNRLGFSKNSYLRSKYQENLFWCPRNAGRRDLHIHTQFTDGLKDLDAIIQESVARVIKVIAITDHNTTDGVEKFITMAAKYGIEVIPGVEFSVLKNIEYAQGDVGVEFHIIGYGIDIEDVRLKNELKKISALFYFKYLSIFYNLFNLDTDYAKVSIPGKVKSIYVQSVEDHIALYKKHGMREMAKKTMAELAALTEDDWQRYFSLIIAVNSEKPIKLTEKDLKFIEKFALCNDAQPRIFELSRLSLEDKLVERGVSFKASKYGLWNIENKFLPSLPTAKEIIELIHNAGGVAVFAHPRWYTDIVLSGVNISESAGIDFVAQEITKLSKVGLDGLEVQTHWIDKVKDKIWDGLARQNNLIITGGTDSHFRGKEELGEGMGGNFYLPNANLEQLIKKIIKDMPKANLHQHPRGIYPPELMLMFMWIYPESMRYFLEEFAGVAKGLKDKDLEEEFRSLIGGPRKENLVAARNVLKSMEDLKSDRSKIYKDFEAVMGTAEFTKAVENMRQKLLYLPEGKDAQADRDSWSRAFKITGAIKRGGGLPANRMMQRESFIYYYVKENTQYALMSNLLGLKVEGISKNEELAGTFENLKSTLIAMEQAEEITKGKLKVKGLMEWGKDPEKMFRCYPEGYLEQKIKDSGKRKNFAAIVWAYMPVSVDEQNEYAEFVKSFKKMAEKDKLTEAQKKKKFLTCVLAREEAFRQSKILLEWMKNERLFRKYIIGVGTCNSEKGYFPYVHAKALRNLKNSGLLVVNHVGEIWKNEGNEPLDRVLDRIEQMLKYTPLDMIIHAAALVVDTNDPVLEKKQQYLLKVIKDKKIKLISCPSSNISLSPDYFQADKYPIKEFLDAAGEVYVATDDDSLFGQNLSDEIFNLWKNSDVGLNEFLNINKKSVLFSTSISRTDMFKVKELIVDNVPMNSQKAVLFIDQAI